VKYLKDYKIFEESEELLDSFNKNEIESIIQYLETKMYDLKDDDYQAEVNKQYYQPGRYYTASIHIKSGDNQVLNSNLCETVKSILDYMESMDYELHAGHSNKMMLHIPDKDRHSFENYLKVSIDDLKDLAEKNTPFKSLICHFDPMNVYWDDIHRGKLKDEYKKFEELDIDIDSASGQKMLEEISNIFIHVKDCGLEVVEVYSGTALGLGDKDIVTDHNQFLTVIGKNGRWEDSFKSLSLRMRMVRDNESERLQFYIDNELFGELQDAISRMEVAYNLKLSSIFLTKGSGIWTKSVSVMKNYIESLPFAQKSSLRWCTYMDITFKDLNEDIDDSVTVNESSDVEQLEKLQLVFGKVRAVIRDFAEDNDIEYEIDFGTYHKLYEKEDSVVFDSINIDIWDDKYNFFIPNDLLLPAIKTLKSMLLEHDLNIDIEMIADNDFYGVDEFFEEYGSEEIHDLGIIIY
jgi:hypothetical protein